jgi:membrane-bound lytic murein transglycosylase D
MSSLQIKRKLLAFSLFVVSNLPNAMAQDKNVSLDEAYLQAKTSLDSLHIKQNYEQGLNLFLDFCDFIHPLQLNALEEMAVAEAQEELSKDDFFYRPDSSSLLLQDHDIAYDFAPYVSDEIVAERLAAMNSTIPMTFNKDIRNFIDYFTIRRRTYTQTMLARKNLYFPMFEKYLAEFNMPDELKYLSIVESALKPVAVSRAGAMGLWQFMPATGRHLGLKQDAYIDERMNPEKSTIAACKYLTWLYEFFGNDWELALAGYNCGPGTVQRAIRKAGGGQQKFWDIYRFLPAETRSYVPMFIAVTYSMTHAEEHNIIQNQPLYPIDYEVITVNQAINLKSLADKLHICLDDLMELNPELKKKVVPKHYKSYALKIPAERSLYFWEHQEDILASAKTEIRYNLAKYSVKNKKTELKERKNKVMQEDNKAKKHLVVKGESLSEIASQYSVSVAQIMAWNKLKSHQIRSGKNLIVKPLGHETKVTMLHGDGNIQGESKINMHPDTNSIAQNNKKEKDSKKRTEKVLNTKQTANLIPTHSNTTHTVKNGESLWIIANKYGTSVKKIRELNAMRNDKLSIGQRLVVK